jgi:PadR family transcriptional regulator, regulatory protein PadR
LYCFVIHHKGSYKSSHLTQTPKPKNQQKAWNNKTISNTTRREKTTTETYKKQITQRIIKNLLDIQLLRMVKAEPLWGYKIKKQVEADFNLKLRHGALYPALNSLEKKGFLESCKQQKDGRARKIYKITTRGKEYLQTYYGVLTEQLESIPP